MPFERLLMTTLGNSIIIKDYNYYYNDDYLKAAREEKDGVLIASKLPELLDRGGFHLTKWVSNSPRVMMSIPEEERAGSIKELDFDQPTIERVLGVRWDIIKDEFVFKVTIKGKPPTTGLVIHCKFDL